MARSKLASMMIILGPLLIFLLLNVAFNAPEQYSLTIGVYSEEYSEVSSSITDQLKASYFSVKEEDSKEECIEEVKGGVSNACLVYPPGMKIGQTEDVVEIFIDHSKNNMVWAIKDILNNKIEGESLKQSANLTQGMLDQIKFIENAIEENTKNTGKGISTLESAENESSIVKGDIGKINLSLDKRNFNITKAKDQVYSAKIASGNAMIKVNNLLDSFALEFDDIESNLIEQGYLENETGEILDGPMSNLQALTSAIFNYSLESRDMAANASAQMNALKTSMKTKMEIRIRPIQQTRTQTSEKA